MGEAKSNDVIGHAEIELSVQMMKEVAEVAAKSAAHEVANSIREEMRMENQRLKEEIIEEVKAEIKSYHGDMTPTQHAVQHSRMDRFLNWTDKMNQNFWGQLIAGFVRWLMIVFLIGYFVWTNGASKVSGAPG